jgi:hypothetical protein
MSLNPVSILPIAWACVSFAQAADQPDTGFLYNLVKQAASRMTAPPHGLMK